jgi:hypothetical protein
MKGPIIAAALLSCTLLPGCNRTESPDMQDNESPASTTMPAPPATPAPDSTTRDTTPGTATPGTTTPGTAPDGTTTLDEGRDTTSPNAP